MPASPPAAPRRRHPPRAVPPRVARASGSCTARWRSAPGGAGPARAAVGIACTDTMLGTTVTIWNTTETLARAGEREAPQAPRGGRDRRTRAGTPRRSARSGRRGSVVASNATNRKTTRPRYPSATIHTGTSRIWPTRNAASRRPASACTLTALILTPVHEQPGTGAQRPRHRGDNDGAVVGDDRDVTSLVGVHSVRVRRRRPRSLPRRARSRPRSR